ncbi:MAG: hypothetical protein P8L78_04585 [Mariniblastus sp.]|nr:hypothetical protein [Mariniblastus sp.]
MLPKQYWFATPKARSNARCILRYQRRPNSPTIIRRFRSQEKANTRIHELSDLGLFKISLSQKSKSGRYGRVLEIKEDRLVFRSELNHHQEKSKRHILLPAILDHSKKQIRKDIKAKYGITYTSKNKELHNGR